MNRKLLNSELGRLTVEEFSKSRKIPVTVVLDNVRSQFNIGSVFRSSDAFAVERVILCGISATPPSAEIHKSALGAELSMQWKHYDESKEAIAELKREGYTIVSVEQTENSVTLSEFTLKEGERYAFVFGNEVHGVQQEVVDMSDLSVEVPQFGTKHSLNVSVCVGVVLWEVASKLKIV